MLNNTSKFQSILIFLAIQGYGAWGCLADLIVRMLALNFAWENKGLV